MAEIYVSMKIKMVLKKWEEEWNLCFGCLDQIGIGNVCFHADILRLSRICGVKEYIVIGGWLSYIIYTCVCIS